LMEILADAGEQKVVVFSQFAKAIALIHRKLVKDKTPHVYLTGKNSFAFDGCDIHKMTRGEVVKTFQNDPLYKIYIGTTQAGGVGITLTAAQTVVFMDKMWTPADQAQAEDRLHRIGQKGSVYVVSILAKGTVEQHIENMLSSKSTMIDGILEHARRIQNDEYENKPSGVTIKDKKVVKQLLERSS
jgi:SNF2 family DNA or RNA helicase